MKDDAPGAGRPRQTPSGSEAGRVRMAAYSEIAQIQMAGWIGQNVIEWADEREDISCVGGGDG